MMYSNCTDHFTAIVLNVKNNPLLLVYICFKAFNSAGVLCYQCKFVVFPSQAYRPNLILIGPGYAYACVVFVYASFTTQFPRLLMEPMLGRPFSIDQYQFSFNPYDYFYCNQKGLSSYQSKILSIFSSSVTTDKCTN